MIGQHITGKNKAHSCCKQHDAVFNCRMVGTFNIKLSDQVDIKAFKSTFETESNSYWFVKICKGSIVKYGWAVRPKNSSQKNNVLEVLTKERLHDTFKEGTLEVTVLEKWSQSCIDNWSKNQYWFQSFPFAKVKKADSQWVWEHINKVNWSGQTVLDIGCHYGFFSFKASELGARVLGVDINTTSLEKANIIQEHIIHQDVEFGREVPQTQFDVVLYLSVHHQIDSEYKSLERHLKILREVAKKHIFVELIMPPMFPQKNEMTETEIDTIVGGEILARYKHKVRGDRKIYWIKK
jgi:SAM-dependent methyltransferase